MYASPVVRRALVSAHVITPLLFCFIIAYLIVCLAITSGMQFRLIFSKLPTYFSELQFLFKIFSGFQSLKLIHYIYISCFILNHCVP